MGPRRRPAGARNAASRGGFRSGALVVSFLLALAASGCGRGKQQAPPPPPPKHFPAAIFDGLGLGMTRAAVQGIHPMRPSLTDSGKNRRLWVYNKPGEWNVDLEFSRDSDDARLQRVDVHFAPGGDTTSEQSIARFENLLGAPDARRRKANINAYGDRFHDQYETIWSDSTQYVFLTERVPISGSARPVFFLTIKKKEIAATGPPTGYVPPPPPKDKDGKPIEESPF